MSTYRVIRKSDGAEVYRYQADEPVEWVGMGFDVCDHLIVSDPPAPPGTDDPPGAWHIHVGPFYDRFGAYKLPILASTDPLVQAIIKDTQVRKYIDLRGRRQELAQATLLLQSKGFAIDATAVLDVMPNAAEVYRG